MLKSVCACVCVCVCEALYNSRWQMEYRLAKHLLIVMLNSLFTGCSLRWIFLPPMREKKKKKKKGRYFFKRRCIKSDIFKTVTTLVK